MSQRRSREASTDDQTPPPTPTTGPEMGQLAMTEDPTSSPLFAPTTDPSPSPFDPPSWEETSSPSSDQHADDSGSPVPSIGRTAKQRARALLPSIKTGVLTAGGIAHSFLTAEGTPEHEYGLYLPDEDDVEAIATPLAGLASRRVPAEAANPDVTDLIGLAFGVVGYVMKQLQKRAGLRRTFPGGMEQQPEDQGDAQPTMPAAEWPEYPVQ